MKIISPNATPTTPLQDLRPGDVFSFGSRLDNDRYFIRGYQKELGYSVCSTCLNDGSQHTFIHSTAVDKHQATLTIES